MMNHIITSVVISFVYLIFKFIEMRFIEEENKPLKLLIRDTAFVFVSSLVGFFILDQLKPIMNYSMGGGAESVASPLVFTEEPQF
jgi:hypothetical protein